MYGKHFDTLYTGSMVGAGPNVFAVWGYVIAKTRDSLIELNPIVLAALIGMKKDEVERAVAYLCKPDPRSRNTEHEGRRLIHDHGFIYYVVSWEIYRGMRDEKDRTTYMRNYMRDYRSGGKDGDVNPVNTGKPALAKAEAETESQQKQSTKAFALSPSDSPPPAPKIVIAFLLNDKTEFGVTKADVDEWSETYPGVDVLAELKKIRLWCKDKPSDRKTRRGARAFVSRWLDRAQNQGRGSRSGPSSEPQRRNKDL